MCIIRHNFNELHFLIAALAPEITESPREERTVNGKTVNMTCRVFGAPKPLVKWVRNSIELTGGRYTVLDNGDLQIRYIISGF